MAPALQHGQATLIAGISATCASDYCASATPSGWSASYAVVSITLVQNIRQAKLVLLFKNGEGRHQNNIQLGRFGRNRSNVWHFASPSAFGKPIDKDDTHGIHPTAKPVALIAEVLMDASRRGDIVLDPFLGSGSTLIAAERTGRRCFGLELDPLYVDATLRRWEALSGKSAIHESELSFAQITQQRSAADETR